MGRNEANAGEHWAGDGDTGQQNSDQHDTGQHDTGQHNTGQHDTDQADTGRADAMAAAAAARRAKYGALPGGVDPADYVVEVPAIPDDRPEAAPPAPAAAPELIAATQVADGQSARGSLADRIARRRHGPTVK